jgi:hypothetical protein
MSDVLYTYTPADDHRVIVSTAFQSLAWLTFADYAERLRYTNLSAERIEAALTEAVKSGQLDRMQLHYTGAIAYRYRFPRAE